MSTEAAKHEAEEVRKCAKTEMRELLAPIVISFRHLESFRADWKALPVPCI